ncbi:hypothetical protein E4U41_002746 [Claviceps citrina]|nr:hypothetical protein E4U41_002746 [Claviceps citrina]
MTPPCASSRLVLAKATPDERVAVWTQHQPQWGPSFDPEAYVRREEQLLDLGLTKDGGLTTWILTTQDRLPPSASASASASASPPSRDGPGGRPILSSLEVYRKRAIVRGADGTVRDVTAHGVASVFTAQQHRRKGYSSELLSLLGDELARQQARDPGSAEFSVLFSDIGRTFYAQQRWEPFPSTHLTFSVNPSSSAATTTTTTTTTTHDDDDDDHDDGCLTLITSDNLATIAELDEQTLRDKLARPPPPGPDTVRAAILPDLATYEWHFARAATLTTRLFDGRSPTVHGALYTPPRRSRSRSSRAWMLWTPAPDKQTLQILRFALEDASAATTSDDDLSAALHALMAVAQAQAREWLCSKMDLWSPDARTQDVARQSTSLRSELVVRETACIASMRWFGEGSISDVEWVDCDKYGWC